jgi:DNA-binding NarL/FixJ family response regulator
VQLQCDSPRAFEDSNNMAPAGPERGLPLRVFIADDSPPVAEMLAQLLDEPGRVEVVGSADSEATILESLRRLRPDVVILDMQLKTGSGTDVLRAMRADAALRQTHVLVTSNHVAPQLRAACLELGAEGYYDKVKELQDLTRKVSDLARARAA